MIALPAAAFSSLGLLIGSLAGLTISPIVVGLITALFAFVGGSAVAFVGQLNRDQLQLASVAVLCLSTFMLVGVVGGSLIRANNLFILNLDQRAKAQENAVSTGNNYMRQNLKALRDDLKSSLADGRTTLDEACEELRTATTQGR